MHAQIAGRLTGRVTKWLVLGFWLVAFVVGATYGSKLIDVQNNETSSWLPATAESTQALDRLTPFYDPDSIPTVDVRSPSAAIVGDLIDDRFKLLEKIGEGGFGETFRARDPNLERDVALKLLKPDASRQEEIAGRVTREGVRLARVSHANVVTVYGAERIDGRVGLWMEFVRGRTLEEELQSDKRFTPAGPDHAQVAACAGIADYADTLFAALDLPHAEARGRAQAVHDAMRQREVELLAPLMEYLGSRNTLRVLGPRNPARLTCRSSSPSAQPAGSPTPFRPRGASWFPSIWARPG